MFSLNTKRFFSVSRQISTRFKVFPSENPVRNRALVESMAESQDKTAFFAWHPNKEISYEFTRPLPTKLEMKSQSVLKEQAIQSAEVAWRLKKPEFTRAALAKVTFTTFHRWCPRARDKKMNYKKTPMDRRYL